MSKCSCDSETVQVRVSDEGIVTHREGERVRLRCVECGGKAGWIPPEALEPFGFAREDVEQSAAPGPQQIHLDVRARWENPAEVDDA